MLDYVFKEIHAYLSYLQTQTEGVEIKVDTI